MLEELPRSLYCGQLPGWHLWQELTDVRTQEVTPNSGVYVGYVLLNAHLKGEVPAIVSVGGFMSDLTTPDRAYEGAQLATLNRPVLMIDQFGHGKSSPHSRRQTYDLCVKRDATSTAEPMVDAIHGILEDTDEVDYFGISHGGHLALKMTEIDDAYRVKTVFGADISGTRNCPTLEVQYGYILEDSIKGRKAYRQKLAGSDTQRDYNSFKWMHERLKPVNDYRVRSFVFNNPGLALLNTFASINARPSALEAWRNIMKKRSTRVEVVTGQNSHVADHQAIDRFIFGLPREHRSRSVQHVLKDDHNLTMTELLPGLVQMAAEAYDRAA